MLVLLLFLPFIDSVWQIYLPIFVLQAASATFTPAFQAIIPDILSDEKDYTKALSLSRLAYDLENLVSPALAGILLAVMNYRWLFGGTVIGFNPPQVFESVVCTISINVIDNMAIRLEAHHGRRYRQCDEQERPRHAYIQMI